MKPMNGSVMMNLPPGANCGGASASPMRVAEPQRPHLQLGPGAIERLPVGGKVVGAAGRVAHGERRFRLGEGEVVKLPARARGAGGVAAAGGDGHESREHQAPHFFASTGWATAAGRRPDSRT